ncbi:DNA polymerase-3 subunit beta [Catalinimonas alkaloidigena]|uniref:Beta sliding clamp n=1 Tax=Catalinimonas alkaloidigena TaxID=1075417 RepID=A0A1G9PH07_9BACT|nr:DNA polymerase III subunit beta [Catalinimonas alkaloidigena]SDL98096.1 DNA polymerase-3 subunit beta [Catalinimonas alkaloidigena]
MKFTVSSSALLKQLNNINGVIASNPVIPILENFLFDIRDGKLTVTASDLQTSMIMEMDIEADADTSIAIPAKILLDTLKNLPEQPVTFVVDFQTYGVEIRSDNGHYKLAGENAVDFPRVPEPREVTTMEVSSEVIHRAVTNTIFATSTDELRPAMTGVLVHMDDSNSTFVATDGHRLIRYRRDDMVGTGTAAQVSIILPRKALNLLKATLPSDSTTLTMSFNRSNAFFSFNNIRMICRLIDERFPDYENAIPLNNPNVLTIERLPLLNSLKRIAIYANKTTHQVRLKISADELNISAEDLDFSNEASETLPCEYEGEPMMIGFNARFLIEMLSNIHSNMIAIELSAPNRAGLILPKEKEDNEDVLMLVMPVMLNNYV